MDIVAKQLHIYKWRWRWQGKAPCCGIFCHMCPIQIFWQKLAQVGCVESPVLEVQAKKRKETLTGGMKFLQYYKILQPDEELNFPLFHCICTLPGSNIPSEGQPPKLENCSNSFNMFGCRVEQALLMYKIASGCAVLVFYAALGWKARCSAAWCCDAGGHSDFPCGLLTVFISQFHVTGAARRVLGLAKAAVLSPLLVIYVLITSLLYHTAHCILVWHLLLKWDI